MYRQDFFKRAIEQLAAALARAMGLAQSEQPAQALESLREAEGALPVVPGILEDMDATTLLETVGAEFAAVLAQVLALEADLQERLGRPLLAQRPRRLSERLRAALAKGSASTGDKPGPT
ncbi:MAG TPA: hypothetical protein VMG12_03345 [Polyangiaceae bacterium]|nr:hypothetical protein [Polyangiaceae bacterium]